MQEYTITWEVEDLKAVSPAAALFLATAIPDQKRSTFLVTNRDSGEQWTFSDPRGYAKGDWQKEVACGDTTLGFIDWVADQMQEEAELDAADKRNSAEILDQSGINLK